MKQTMTKYTVKSVLLLCLLLVSAGLFAASEAEYGKVSKAWTLHADGSQEYRYTMELTLFTHTAMNGTYGESFIVYNPAYQQLKIHTSYTKQKDGTIIRTPENAFVEVLPRYATNAAAYNHLKEMVVVHTGLELGATIYLDYSVVTKPGFFPALDLNEVVQETSPVKSYTLSVSVPEGKTLHWQLYAATVRPAESHQGGMDTYTWTLRHTPASSREPLTAQNRDGVPRLVASTYASQAAALAELAKRFTAAKAMEADTYAQFITEKAQTVSDKVAAIQKYVVNELGTSGVPLADAGYTIRNDEDIVRSAYGTMAEKTQLLWAMLKAAGVQATVVAVYPGNLDPAACGLKAFKSLAVKVTAGGKDQYLSATSVTPLSLDLRGGLDQLVALDGTSVSLIMAPKEVNDTFDLAVAADKAVGGRVVFTLPAPVAGADEWAGALTSHRTQLLEIPSCLHQTAVYTLTPAAGLKLEAEKYDQTLTEPFGTFSQALTTQNGKVVVTRSLVLNKMQYTPAEYARLRALVNEWVNPSSRVLLFTAE